MANIGAPKNIFFSLKVLQNFHRKGQGITQLQLPVRLHFFQEYYILKL